jgi:1-acyl-sn-glycerol-3-phosphate acyltransferase
MTKVLIESAADANTPMIQLFPEGATTNGNYMLRFHLGAFLSDLPIQPAAIRYTLWGTSKRISHLSWFHNYPRQWLAFLSIPFRTADVTFLPTVSLKEYEADKVRAFADDVSFGIANFLGVPIVDLTTSSIYKASERR